MANFSIPYTTEANYTFDSSVIEIIEGIAKLKNLTPTNETFYASYNIDINGNRGLGVLTGTAVGGASVSGGKLDLAHGDVRYVSYDANQNADSQQTGCVRFKVIFNYNGSPSTDNYLFSIMKDDEDGINSISLRHRTSGRIYAYIIDENNVLIGTTDLGYWYPILGQEYEFELNWDITLGEKRLFIDGILFSAKLSEFGTRSSDINLLRIGSNYSGATTSNFKIDDFQVFDTVQHTANYTPVAIPETSYANDSPTVYKTLGDSVANIEEFISFAETLGVGNQGLVRYQLSDDGISWLYWNGSIWTTAGVSDYNTDAECVANMLSFDATADKIYVKAFLISDGSQKVELDENQVGYVVNTAPSVYAGLNKTAIYNTSISPFSDCLFSDAEGNIVKAEWKVEGGAYVEILQGAYASLLLAVQAFTNAFTHSGNKNIYLKITDSYDASTEDILVINVNQVTVTVNIVDSKGNNIPNVTFDAGDSSTPSVESSPFSFTYDIGTFTSNLSKSHFDSLSQENIISISTTEVNFIMSQETRIDDLIININAPRQYISGDTFTLDGVININLTGYKIRCSISDITGNEVQLATENSGGSDAQIEITNASAGEFIITCAKDLTTDFDEDGTIEIEVENVSEQVRTMFKKDVRFEKENLTWTTPSS